MRVLFIVGWGLERLHDLGPHPREHAGRGDPGEVNNLWERGIGLDMTCGCGAAFGRCEFWTPISTSAFGEDRSWVADRGRRAMARLGNARFITRRIPLVGPIRGRRRGHRLPRTPGPVVPSGRRAHAGTAIDRCVEDPVACGHRGGDDGGRALLPPPHPGPSRGRVELQEAGPVRRPQHGDDGYPRPHPIVPHLALPRFADRGGMEALPALPADAVRRFVADPVHHVAHILRWAGLPEVAPPFEGNRQVPAVSRAQHLGQSRSVHPRLGGAPGR